MAKPNKNNQFKFSRNRGIVLFKDLLPFARFVAAKLGLEITAEGLDIVESQGGIHLQNKATAGGSSTHPFEVRMVEGKAVVNPASFLFKSLSHTDTKAITGIGSPLTVVDGDSIWLEIEWTSWPDDYTASIDVGEFPAGGEIEDDEDTPATQTKARKCIATIDDVGGVLTVTQLVFTHMEMRLFQDGGLFVLAPRPF